MTTVEDLLFPCLFLVGGCALYWARSNASALGSITALARHTVYERLFGEEKEAGPPPQRRTMRPPPSTGVVLPKGEKIL